MTRVAVDLTDHLSGFTDVMALSVLTGGCWRALRQTTHGFRPVSQDPVMASSIHDELVGALNDLSRNVGRLHRWEVAAAALMAYAPRVDDDESILVAARTISQRIAQLAARSSSDTLSP